MASEACVCVWSCTLFGVAGFNQSRERQRAALARKRSNSQQSQESQMEAPSRLEKILKVSRNFERPSSHTSHYHNQTTTKATTTATKTHHDLPSKPTMEPNQDHPPVSLYQTRDPPSHDLPSRSRPRISQGTHSPTPCHSLPCIPLRLSERRMCQRQDGNAMQAKQKPSSTCGLFSKRFCRRPTITYHGRSRRACDGDVCMGILCIFERHYIIKPDRERERDPTEDITRSRGSCSVKRERNQKRKRNASAIGQTHASFHPQACDLSTANQELEGAFP